MLAAPACGAARCAQAPASGRVWRAAPRAVGAGRRALRQGGARNAGLAGAEGAAAALGLGFAAGPAGGGGGVGVACGAAAGRQPQRCSWSGTHRRGGRSAGAAAEAAGAGADAASGAAEGNVATGGRYAPGPKPRLARPHGPTVVDARRGRKHSLSAKALRSAVWAAPDELLWVPMQRPDTIEEFNDYRRTMAKQRNSLQRYGFRESIEVWKAAGEKKGGAKYYVVPRKCWRLWAAAELDEVSEIPVRVIGTLPERINVRLYRPYADTADGRIKTKAKGRGGRPSKALREELVGPDAVPPAPSEYRHEWRHTYAPWLARVQGEFTGDTLSLRGLPFQARRQHVARWAEQAARECEAGESFVPPAKEDVYIPLVNGRRSGAALLRFRSNAHARNAREALHRRDMEVGARSRYVEAFPATDDALEQSIDMGYSFDE